ncbi:hypothetical protein BsWGS_23460 [Bradybaena similaris]
MSFENNTSNATSGTFYTVLLPYTKFRDGSFLFLTIVGTALNLWFLVAILSSPVIRSRLRNKLICSSFVLHLINCAFILPTTLGTMNQDLNCALLTAVINVELMQDLVSNWLLIELISVFIAQIQDFNPRSRLSSRAATLGTIVLLAFPWVASLVAVPVIAFEFYRQVPDEEKFCFFLTFDALEVLRSMDTALPIILAILLVTAAAVMRHRRFTLRNSSGMQTELLDPGPEIDSTLAYVIAVIVATLCDFLRLIFAFAFDLYWLDFLTLMKLNFLAYVLPYYRAVLAPLPWLLLPDIRQRIRTWRPWHRPSPGVDLTMAYKRERS